MLYCSVSSVYLFALSLPQLARAQTVKARGISACAKRKQTDGKIFILVSETCHNGKMISR